MAQIYGPFSVFAGIPTNHFAPNNGNPDVHTYYTSFEGEGPSCLGLMRVPKVLYPDRLTVDCEVIIAGVAVFMENNSVRFTIDCTKFKLNDRVRQSIASAVEESDTRELPIINIACPCKFIQEFGYTIICDLFVTNPIVLSNESCTFRLRCAFISPFLI